MAGLLDPTPWCRGPGPVLREAHGGCVACSMAEAPAVAEEEG